MRKNYQMMTNEATNNEPIINSKKQQNSKSRIPVLTSASSSYSKIENSISQKLLFTHNNDLHKDEKQKYNRSSGNSIYTPGSSKESSELGTSCESDERSASIESNEVM